VTLRSELMVDHDLSTVKSWTTIASLCFPGVIG
jgi:hypothetical protein